MAIFKQKGRTNSKRHKFHLFKLGGGAKLHKNFAKKFLATSLCAAVVLLGATAALFSTPAVTSAGTNEPTAFITSAKANHWGRSDLRKYLNGVEKVDNTLQLDTTHTERKTSGYYESQFSDAEYTLVQPFTYSTNVLNSESEAASTYDTTDRFWLLSGNYSSDQVLSWGATDVSLDSTYTNLAPARVVPISYWPGGVSSGSWLRSPHCFYVDEMALCVVRGDYVNYSIVMGNVAAAAADAAFKLDLSSVLFASAASAAPLATGGSRKFEIEGSSNFGKKTSSALPDYGMYLKQSSSESFAATGLSYSGTQLTVNYTGGVAGQYVVVQAFKEDNLEAVTTSYEAAYQLAAANVGDNKSIELGVSSWKDDSDQQLANLDGYTIKVWMEDASGGSSLAAASTPVTFVGSGGSITKTETGAATNQRVFAMKNDLQTSWGDLSKLSDTDLSNVKSGSNVVGTYGGDSFVTGKVAGVGATNQKIYYGKDTSGDPLQFWIAGREDKADGGEVDSDGEIMTLYQARSDGGREFNASSSNYAGNGNTVTLQLASEQTAGYTGSAVAYPEDKVTAEVINSSYPSDKTPIQFKDLGWQHRAQGTTAWIEGMPTALGTYEIRCHAADKDNYERTYSAPVTFEITKATPTYTAPPLNATYGDMLSSLTDSLGKPTGVNNTELKGSWAWVDGDNETVGAVGKHNYTAKFTPTDKTNYDWSAITGWDSTNGCFTVEVTVTVKADTSNWGTAEVRSADGKTQYVDSTGRTSIELSSENLDGNGILWLHEKSDGTGAWYGIDLSTLAFELDKGYRFYVQWLSPHDAEYDTYYSQLDDEQKARVEGDNGWLFLIGVEGSDGKKVPPAHPVNVYVQLGDPNEGADWDLEHLKAYYINSGADEEVPVEAVINFPFPEGTDEFGLMHLSHFSPYFVFDEFTDEERAALAQKSDANSPVQSDNQLLQSGDLAAVLLISGLAVVLVASLGVLLVLIIRKKKFED